MASLLRKVANWKNTSPTRILPKQLLQEISAFFKDSAAAAQPIQQASGNSTIDQGTCNTLLGPLKNLGDRAKALADKLNITPPEQTKPFKELLDLCKAQGALVADITKATTPSTGLSLLRDILKHLQDENDLVQHIDRANDASNIGKCREDVKKLAVLTPLPADQMKRIESALSDPVPETLGRWQALLAEALVLIDGDVDDRFYQTTGWHNKLIWLVGCGLLLLVGLGLVFENGVLLLVGAVGGLLSRLQRTIEKADVPTDYGATWGALFLSPLTGALTAWGGILLIVLGVNLNIFGTALNLLWNDPYNPTTLALALAFGFSERWFSGLIDTVQSKVVAPAGSTSTFRNHSRTDAPGTEDRFHRAQDSQRGERKQGEASGHELPGRSYSSRDGFCGHRDPSHGRSQPRCYNHDGNVHAPEQRYGDDDGHQSGQADHRL